MSHLWSRTPKYGFMVFWSKKMAGYGLHKMPVLCQKWWKDEKMFEKIKNEYYFCERLI